MLTVKFLLQFLIENLTHSFNTTKKEFYSSESIQLKCYGKVDIPKFLRISIEKKNVTLNDTDNNEVQYNTNNTNSQQYGIYKCIIAAGRITFEETIFLRNKGNFFTLFINYVTVNF